MGSREFVVRLVAELSVRDRPDLPLEILQELSLVDPDAEMAEGPNSLAVYWTRVPAPSIEDAVVEGARRVRASASRAMGSEADDAWPVGVTNDAIEAYPVLDSELEDLVG